MLNPDNPFGFAIVQSVVIVIPDIQGDPMSWKYQIYNIPNTNKEFDLSCAVYKENEFLYILGRMNSYVPILARIRFQFSFPSL